MDRGDFLFGVKKKRSLSGKNKRKLVALIFGLLILIALQMLAKDDSIAKKKELKSKDIKQKETSQEKKEAFMKSPDAIRVLLKNTDYSSIFHDAVDICSDSEMVVKNEKEETKYKAGESFCVKKDDMPKEKIVIEGGNLTLRSLKRDNVSPAYSGRIELFPTKEGFVLVNEVEFETYIKGVVPGEMPAGWEMEALKAQAVCVRSYAALKCLGNEAYPEYQADLDDSVQYQVYMNKPLQEKSNQAVTETKGEVLTCNNDIATTFYFSTSWGYTTGMDAWLKEGVSYLTPVIVGEAKTVSDFEKSLLSPEGEFYEANEPWYRWECSYSMDNYKADLFQNLTQISENNPEDVKVWDEKKKNYEAGEIKKFENVQGMEILKRGSGGVVLELLITTNEQKVLIAGQHNIRKVLSPGKNIVRRQDGSTVENMTLLPSGFFILELKEDNAQGIKDIIVKGGGFGHGVGLSQAGANQMAKSGKNYKEILLFFYQGTEVEKLEEKE